MQIANFRSRISASLGVMLSGIALLSPSVALSQSTNPNEIIQSGQLSACQKGERSQSGACKDRAPQDSIVPHHGIPSSVCRPGFVAQGSRLCMTGNRGPDTFTNAMLSCMDNFGRVADYHDWRYRRFRGDGLPAPVGFWLGEITADNRALFVNLANDADFDGETSRFDSRNYVCAHDRS